MKNADFLRRSEFVKPATSSKYQKFNWLITSNVLQSVKLLNKMLMSDRRKLAGQRFFREILRDSKVTICHQLQRETLGNLCWENLYGLC